MAFEITITGHSADPHNKEIKALFDATILTARKLFGSSGSVNGQGYSTDASGTLEFNAQQTVDPAKVAADKRAAAVAEAQVAVDEAAVNLDVANAGGDAAAIAKAQADYDAAVAAFNSASDPNLPLPVPPAPVDDATEDAQEAEIKAKAIDNATKAVAAAQAQLDAANAANPPDQAAIDTATANLASANQALADANALP